ncbi:hypothetical protein [Streptosporangium sp. NPDC000396]|uniref:hypothetical protein n=1 Tax=Streptosporangium sp. NPDC000396 TaxID=3366185 RepID=UPI0036B6A94C
MTERLVPWIAAVWALAYAAVRGYWVLAGEPAWGRGSDLTLPGWSAIGLCVAAAAVVVALRTTGGRAVLVLAAWVLSVALTGAAAMVLLDVVGGILPDMGIPQDGMGFLSRMGCLAVAALTGATALAYQRRLRGCARCSGIPRLARTPRWAYLGAYAAVTGFAFRVFAQFALFDSDGIPSRGGPQLLIFEAGFVLGGVLLPLALVHSWGKVWPRWVVPLAGRRVPRWLVVGPGFAVAGALCGYFGMGLAQLVLETLNGTLQQPVFMWVAVPAYVMWGVGVATASVAYYRITRPACAACGR